MDPNLRVVCCDPLGRGPGRDDRSGGTEGSLLVSRKCLVDAGTLADQTLELSAP